MHSRTRLWVASVTMAAALAGCGESARHPLSAGIGPDPALPPPVRTAIPTVHIAPAEGWTVGRTPATSPGTSVKAFAAGLDHPRWLYVLPNGDVLVAETNAPPKPDDSGGIKGWIRKLIMKRAGAGVPSANRLTLLRDADGDGIAEMRSPFLENLWSPFGIALVDGALYVANTDGVVRFPYTTGATRITDAGTTLVALPAGPINHHWTKNLIASRDGSKLYVTVGSNSNVAERGIDNEDGRAAIWEVDRATGAHRVFAAGLRNPNGLAWEPIRGSLWTVVNERDELGSDLVPDYLTSVTEGAFYGWPYSYFGQHVDHRVTPPRPDLVAKAIEARLCPRRARRPAWSGVLRRQRLAAAVRDRDVHRPARILEPKATQRLQRGLRAVPRRRALRSADRSARRFPQPGWQGLWPAGGSRPGRAGRAARRR